MIIDQQTFRDLEIFGTDDGAPSLFERLDRTVSRGGREALRRRFLQPLTDLAAIRSVQSSVAFLLHNAGLEDLRPAEAVLVSLLRYLDSPYVAPRLGSGLRASLEYWEIRLRYPDVYRAAVSGVRTTAAVLCNIDQFAQELEAAGAPGDLKALTEDLVQLLRDREVQGLLSERALNASGSAAVRLDGLIRDHCAKRIRRILHLVHEIDALISMAKATREQGYSIPNLVSGDQLRIRGLRHPFLAGAVRNDCEVNEPVTIIFLTGPNMAGKTTFLKACASAVFLAQLGTGVPAESMEFAPFEAVFTGLRTSDNLTMGVSYFQAEARRVKQAAGILAAGTRALIVFDELFKGTNVKDALDASHQVLQAFVRARRSTLVVSSHLVELVDLLIQEHRIAFRCFDAIMTDGVPRFDYRLKSGASSQRLGLAVLRNEGVFNLLEQIAHLDA